MNNSPIGIFDSGVGGLTVLSELQKLLPHESFIYVADQTYAPYGKRTKKEIKERSIKITNFLLSKKAKIIIVACNTATIQSIERLRRSFTLPVIGVVPVIKTAAEKTKTKKIAVFATPATTNSAYLTFLIQKYAKDLIVYKNGATGLENLIEEGDLANPKIEKILKEHLLPLKNEGVDVIALGCTHYPFLKNRMQEIVGPEILILDSGGAVARNTKRVLTDINDLSLAKKRKDWYYTTGEVNKFQNIVKELLSTEIVAEHINI